MYKFLTSFNILYSPSIKRLVIFNYTNDKRKENSMKYTVEEIIAALKEISLVNPYHMTMVSDGYGEFPDGYKLTEVGAERLIEELKNKLA
jgi:cystathionine beta-lyase family protein involved in aluminum resistance